MYLKQQVSKEVPKLTVLEEHPQFKVYARDVWLVTLFLIRHPPTFAFQKAWHIFLKKTRLFLLCFHLRLSLGGIINLDIAVGSESKSVMSY